MGIVEKLFSCSVLLKYQFLLDFYALFVHCADIQCIYRCIFQRYTSLKKILFLLAVMLKLEINKFFTSLVFMDFLEIRHMISTLLPK